MVHPLMVIQKSMLYFVDFVNNVSKIVYFVDKELEVAGVASGDSMLM